MSSSAPLNNGNVVPLRPPQECGDERSEVAVYIGQMSLELEKLANTAGFELIAYFLALARIEADAQARTPRERMPPQNPQAPYATE